MYSQKLIEKVRANAALLQQAADALYGAASSMKNVNQEENERTGLDGFWKAVLETQQKHYHTAMEVLCKEIITRMLVPDDIDKPVTTQKPAPLKPAFDLNEIPTISSYLTQ